MTTNIEAVASAIAAFAADLKNCGCMGTRRDAIRFLAGKIGAGAAIKVAYAFGLKDSFYTVGIARTEGKS